MTYNVSSGTLNPTIPYWEQVGMGTVTCTRAALYSVYSDFVVLYVINFLCYIFFFTFYQAGPVWIGH